MNVLRAKTFRFGLCHFTATNMSIKSNFNNALVKGTTFNVDPVGWAVDWYRHPL